MPTYRFSLDLALHQSRSLALWIRHNLGSGEAAKVIAARLESVRGIQQIVIPFPTVLIKGGGPELMLAQILINKINFGEPEEKVFEYLPGERVESPFVFQADEAGAPEFYHDKLDNLTNKIDSITIGNFDKSGGKIAEYYGQFKKLWLAVYDLVRFFDNVFLILEGRKPCVFNKRFEFSPTRDILRELPLLGEKKTKVMVETLVEYREKLFEASRCPVCCENLIYNPQLGIVSLLCGHKICGGCISKIEKCIYCHEPKTLYTLKVGIPENVRFFEMELQCGLCEERVDKERAHHCRYSEQSRASLIKRLQDQRIQVVEPSVFKENFLNNPDDGKIYAISIFERKLAFLLATCYKGYVGLCVCSMYYTNKNKGFEKDNKDIEIGSVHVYVERIINVQKRILQLQVPYINSLLKVLRRDIIEKQPFAYYTKVVIESMNKVTLESKFNKESVDDMSHGELLMASINPYISPKDFWREAMGGLRDEYIVEFVNKNIRWFDVRYWGVQLERPTYVILSNGLTRDAVFARSIKY